ncbi:hypothetical protein AAHH80_34215, partial [Burkholderia pseudomallei]
AHHNQLQKTTELPKLTPQHNPIIVNAQQPNLQTESILRYRINDEPALRHEYHHRDKQHGTGDYLSLKNISDPKTPIRDSRIPSSAV